MKPAAHSDVQGGWPGAGNIDADPLFVDALARDYRLQTASPCRDAGRTESLPNDRADIDWDGSAAGVLPKDLDLNPRINGPSVDIGAHEWTTAEGSE